MLFGFVCLVVELVLSLWVCHGLFLLFAGFGLVGFSRLHGVIVGRVRLLV